MTAARRIVGGLVAAYVAGTAIVSAQGRPYQSLFGPAGEDPNVRQALDFTVTLAGAYDTNVTAEQLASTTQSPLQVEGAFTEAALDVRYHSRGERTRVVASGGTVGRYFPDLQQAATLGHYGGVGLLLPIGEKTSVTVNQALTYTPSYLYGLFVRALQPAVGDVVPAAASYTVADRRSLTSATGVILARRVGRRASLDFNAGYRSTDFLASTAADFRTYDVGGRYGYPIGRDMVLRLGYVYRHGTYGAERTPVQHDVAVGVDYNRPLSRSRRTLLGMSLGTSVLDAPPPGQAAAASVKQLHAVANVLLTHQLRRTWTARAAYRRGSQFVEGLTGPVFTDGVTLTADGFFNRRTDLAASAAYLSGEALDGVSGPFETYTATARVRVGLTRRWAVYSEYLYYFYDFARGAALVTELPSRVGRNSVRIGLTLWVPVIRK